jgi:deoxyribose-phosphate aldolase
VIEKIIESEMTRYRESYAPIVREVNEDIELAGYIDHTLLKADATPEMIVRLCQEAREFNFWSVCVNTGYLSLVSKALEGSP